MGHPVVVSAIRVAMAWCRFLRVFLVSFLLLCCSRRGVAEDLVTGKLSGIIIPGFASTQLRAWSVLDCPYSPLDFNPLDLVWLDTTKLLSAVNCWLKCILLDPYNQTDHPECKSRPDSGLSAITELDPGYITGPLSSVWKEWLKWCIEFGIEANAIIAVPYDWRLPPSVLEERDLYFHRLNPQGTARLMYNSFGSSLWLLPFSKYCRADNTYWKHFFDGKEVRYHTQHCDDMEFQSNYSGWPTDIVNIEVPSIRGPDAYPSILEVAQDATSGVECGRAVQMSFSAREVADGTFFKAIEDYDPDSGRLLHQLEKSGNSVSGNPGPTSGDETVPYNSLSWCKTWLGPKVNITRAPQTEHDGSDVQTVLNVEHHKDRDLISNMTRSPQVKYITYYEDAESIPGKRTAIWELDKANHRNIVRSPVLMRELWLQMWHDIHPDARSKFVTKARRGPLRDVDCYWDYGKARCAWPEYCEYRYVFGDVHLGQSCRLKNGSKDLLLHYLDN